MVNGAEAITGAVILSGAQLATSAVSLATVQLDNLGTVTIAPKSNVTLSFDSTSVAVRILSGDATLSTVNGVKGTVVNANGTPRNVPSAPVPTDADTARNWGIAGVAVGSAAFIWALIAWNKANDASDKADALAAQLAALRACLATQATSPVRVCTSF
jgi:ferric-dicitrate binding protein FerR (iron transport regulator)